MQVDKCSPREWGCYSCEGIELKRANSTTCLAELTGRQPNAEKATLVEGN